ncbi:VOC family protein [Labrenzia sp. PHM005]|uniref:VOC family protein n=1 Tax=Labrenzia sp. PHM005 TaxID=2590016 RepID=UPI00113FDE71|nr:VOC family protein [Labrenzia sp. PHM005]QDG76869.1 glyoxalase/bleomycin resistance/dioxygenase family protein [Labrenzia sp. PHM005]
MSLKSIKSVDYVVIVCRDLERARDFYSRVLGFQIEYERDDWIRFQVGPVSLTLRPESGLFSRRELTGPALQLAFEVPLKDLDQCFQELESHGAAIIAPPKDQTWGHRTLYFTDPEGNILEIYAEID